MGPTQASIQRVLAAFFLELKRRGARLFARLQRILLHVRLCSAQGKLHFVLLQFIFNGTKGKFDHTSSNVCLIRTNQSGNFGTQGMRFIAWEKLLRKFLKKIKKIVSKYCIRAIKLSSNFVFRCVILLHLKANSFPFRACIDIFCK